MRALRAALVAAALLPGAASALAQADYRVYEERPRIFLERDRLERLRRDVDRQSLRWQALNGLITAGANFAEQPLVDALLYQAGADRDSGLRAVRWAVSSAANGLGTSAELRLVALVYDWCHDLFGPQERLAAGQALAASVESLLPMANLGAGPIRAAILAAIALAGEWDGSEAALASLLETHWQSDLGPGLQDGSLADDAASLIAVLEAALAVRHNLDRDPLEPGVDGLRSLARARLASYYPVDIETSEGLMRRPSRFGANEEEARAHAPLDRIAEMLMVAYEANLREFQFVQGWIRDETYLPRSTLLSPYEFLWVNPYLPGLTAESSPLVTHDRVRGRLYGRSSWQRRAAWLGYSQGRLELFANGDLSAADSMRGLAPVYFPESVAVPVAPPARIVISWEPSRSEAPQSVHVYLIGLRAGESYGLKIAGHPPRLIEAGAGGIAVIRSDPGVPKRDRIDFRRKVRIDIQPTLKPTRAGRPRPSLGR